MKDTRTLIIMLIIASIFAFGANQYTGKYKENTVKTTVKGNIQKQQIILKIKNDNIDDDFTFFPFF